MITIIIIEFKAGGGRRQRLQTAASGAAPKRRSFIDHE